MNNHDALGSHREPCHRVRRESVGQSGCCEAHGRYKTTRLRIVGETSRVGVEVPCSVCHVIGRCIRETNKAGSQCVVSVKVGECVMEGTYLQGGSR